MGISGAVWVAVGGIHDVTACAWRYRRSKMACSNGATPASPNRGNGCARSLPATSRTTRCPPTRRPSARTGTTSCRSGDALWSVAARRRALRGRRWIGSPANGFRLRASFTLGQRIGSPSEPEVGAVCLNWARTDLCGGCRVTGIPTAIANTWPSVTVDDAAFSGPATASPRWAGWRHEVPVCAQMVGGSQPWAREEPRPSARPSARSGD